MTAQDERDLTAAEELIRGVLARHTTDLTLPMLTTAEVAVRDIGVIRRHLAASEKEGPQ